MNFKNTFNSMISYLILSQMTKTDFSFIKEDIYLIYDGQTISEYE